MQESFSLAEMLGRAMPRVEVVDVGAMALPGEAPPYEPLVRAEAARVTGFEPVQVECDKLNASARKSNRYLPYFIGDGSERTFHTCNHTMTSSLYEPDTALLRRFQALEEVTRVVDRSHVTTRRLDDLEDLGRVDFLKIDVQGAELDVLRGGMRALAGVLVVHVEVEFVPMYKAQPLFAEVDTELRRRGLAFHTFTSISGRVFKPLASGKSISEALRQLLWADAVYVRDFMRLGELEPPDLLRTAAILHDCYQSSDLAALCLQHHDAKTGQQLWKYFMQRLVGGIPLAEPL